MKIITCTFDPITQKELVYLLSLRKEKKEDIYLKVSGDGILTIKEREQLIKAAIRPFSHLHIYQGRQKGDYIHAFEAEEKSVREGNIYLAAHGTITLIHQHGYYYECICEAMCNEHRTLHSKSVAKTAVLLATYHNLDTNISYKMGLLHDITKRLSDAEGRKILEIYYPEGLSYDPKVWHSFTAPIICKKKLCLNDPTILNAIWHHTLGDGNSDYDHILYIADKIEPTRGYDASYEYALAKKSLKECAHYVRDKSKKYILEKEGKHV